ncbi:stage II sporulation protein D [Aminipila luticellarii]|uniref:Stage II sporulation protein D n=1 Tax=Aminipila luticellarii TaxID=2507160 RepID=A0A410PT97_9FIRM|nr:stage II sporulation protein D [Aminipila luticellarii]QAT42134.1 stage II sporulation protein D [Aminipila luticellarii]
MKITKKTILYIVIAELFTFILLPSLLLGVHGIFNKLPAPAVPKIFVNKVEIPKNIRVYRHTYGVTEVVPFEDYVKGVVAGEMPSNFETEALKAQAVAARTYSLSKIIRSGDGGNPPAHPDAPLCDDTHCQVYRSVYDLTALKGDNWMQKSWPKICKAVDSTKGQLMYYDGQLAEQALFHSSSGGRTENSEDVFASAVPYLRSVDSPYEEGATHQEETKYFSTKDFIYLINLKYPDRKLSAPISKVEIVSKSDGGRVEEIKVNNSSYQGRELRDALGLSSANFKISLSNGTITITSTGFGHGVGMSQYGANGMAQRGSNYKEILAHYYTGVKIY